MSSLQFSIQIGYETYRDAISASHSMTLMSHGIDSCCLTSHIAHESITLLISATMATKMACLQLLDPDNNGGSPNSGVIYMEAVRKHKCTICTAAGKQELLNYA